jgi:hypothetical protein
MNENVLSHLMFSVETGIKNEKDLKNNRKSIP